MFICAVFGQLALSCFPQSQTFVEALECGHFPSNETQFSTTMDNSEKAGAENAFSGALVTTKPPLYDDCLTTEWLYKTPNGSYTDSIAAMFAAGRKTGVRMHPLGRWGDSFVCFEECFDFSGELFTVTKRTLTMFHDNGVTARSEMEYDPVLYAQMGVSCGIGHTDASSPSSSPASSSCNAK